MSDYFTVNELRVMQSKPFEEKVLISQAKILQLIQLTKGKIYVAFSGGKDSSVLLDIVAGLWAASSYKNSPLHVGMANTTAEYSGMLQHAKNFVKLMEQSHGIAIALHITKPDIKLVDLFKTVGYPVASKETANKIYYVRNDMNKYGITWNEIKDHLDPTCDNEHYLKSLGFNDTVVMRLCGMNNGKAVHRIRTIPRKWLPLLYAPFKVSHKCCDYLKKIPQHKLEHELGGYSAILGEMAEESIIRETQYRKTGCVFKNGRGGYRGKPLGFWTEQDILHYLYYRKLPIFKYYGQIIYDGSMYHLTGINRTGCKFCMFGCQFKTGGIHYLKALEPRVAKVISKPIADGGLGFGEVATYLNENCKCNIDLGG